jgi:hypothetical protein
MKSFLFEATVRVTYFLVWLIERVGAVVVFLPLWTTHKLKWLVATIGHGLMGLIDGERLSEIEEEEMEADEESETKAIHDELSLLVTAGKVRDHASELGDWTESHTQALNAIGDALLNQCYWEEDDVHQYLRSVVESIDGLEYHLPDEDD